MRAHGAELLECEFVDASAGEGVVAVDEVVVEDDGDVVFGYLHVELYEVGAVFSGCVEGGDGVLADRGPGITFREDYVLAAASMTDHCDV